MRAVIQRVSRAVVTVNGDVVGRVDRGLLVYAGVAADDGPTDAEQLAKKIRHLRVFPDDAGKMNLDIAQADGGVLVISNFTLQADVRQGRRPAFTAAAAPETADMLYRELCERLRQLGLPVETGSFGAMMLVEAVNDGPVNILVDTKKVF